MATNRWPYLIVLLLLPPALLIHLGYMPLIDDEAIRALVALEMGWSGNWVTPTLHADYYYNKPPLWNWILGLFFTLAGSPAEWVARLPTVICLLGYAATIYYYGRRHLQPATAFLAALAFITCGRVLFWDSMLALIDTCFSWVMFTLFMVVFHEFERQRWWRLFAGSYLLMSVGFLMKGLPAIVFQGVTLVVWLAWQGQFRRLFSLPHILSGLGALALIGSYYLVYHQYNSLEAVFSTLFNESSKRTVVRFGLGETALQIISFPFELIYHFLPWSLLVFYLARPDLRRLLRESVFTRFLAVVLVANLIPYWTSPEVYPRYLLMLVPLLFLLGFHFYERRAARAPIHRAIQTLLLVFAAVLSLAWVAPFFSARLQAIPAALPISALLLLASAALAWQAWRQPDARWLWVMAVMLVFRIGFNLYVLPDRLANDYGEKCRQTSLAAGQRWQGRPLYVYHHTLMQPTNSYYLQRAYGGIIPRKTDRFTLQDYYIVNPAQFPGASFILLDSFLVRHGRQTYYIAQLKDTLPPRQALIPAEPITPLPPIGRKR